MVEFIIGKAGTEKSQEIFKRINALGAENVILLVPDQFSFDTEIAVYNSIAKDKLINVSVTTFSKLAEKIITLYDKKGDYADDIVKKMTMFRTLSEMNQSMEFYSKHLKKPEFPSFMLDVIASLKSAGITTEALKKVCDSELPDTLSDKLNDIYIIYEEYTRNLHKAFSDRLDDVMKAAVLAEANGFFADKLVFVDNFETFSGNQMAFVKTIISTAQKCTITLTTDAEESNEQQFYATNKLIAKLKSYADKAHVTVLEPKALDIEKHASEATDIYAECRFIAAKINELCVKNDYRYKDVAVLCGDSSYSRVLESEFTKYNVPAFIDIPESIIEKPLARFVLFLLDALSLDTEALLRYIKTGYVFVNYPDAEFGSKRIHITRKSINMLEKFARKWGLTAKDWAKPFPAKRKGFAELEILEALRKDIVEPLQELKSKLIGTTGDIMTKELCAFLMDSDKLNIASSIAGLCKTNREQSTDELITDTKKVEEYRQLWGKIITVFESAYASLAGFEMDLSSYRKLIAENFRSVTIARPPQFIDSVTVGDITRTRTSAPKIVFICGVNEGIVPASVKVKGAFSASEVELLLGKDLAVGKDRTERFSSELLSVYKAVNMPSEKLWLTYALTDLDGNVLERSHIIDNMKLETEIAAELGSDFYCRTERTTNERLAELYGQWYSPERASLMLAVNDEEYKESLEASAKMLGRKGYIHEINDTESLKLLQREVYSPSAIEAMDKCRYSYFCKYVLGLKEDTESGINSLEIGNIVHSILENVLADYRDDRKAFVGDGSDDKLKTTTKKVNELVDVYKQKYLDENMLADYGQDGRYIQLYNAIGRTAAKLAVNTIREFEISSYKPVEFEKEVEFKLEAENKQSITIKGKLDRLDMLIAEEKGKEQKYYRVVDYKTGSTKMEVGRLNYGQNVQMLLYLDAICKENEGKPAAVLYYPSKDNTLVKEDSSYAAKACDFIADESLQASFNAAKIKLDRFNWLDNHVPSGISIAYDLSGEEAIDGEIKTKIAEPDAASKDLQSVKERYRLEAGSSDKKNFINAYDFFEDEYRVLINHIEKTVLSNVNEISRGKFDAKPFVTSSDDTCSLCSYRAFCGHDENNPEILDMTRTDELTGRGARLAKEKAENEAQKKKGGKKNG